MVAVEDHDIPKLEVPAAVAEAMGMSRKADHGVILRNVARAMGNDGRLLVVESLISPDSSVGKLLDLAMLALPGGEERTAEEYQVLFQSAGLRLNKIVPTKAEVSVIEGVKVCAGGGQVSHDAEALSAAVKRDEVEYEIFLPGEGAETEVYFSDLGHEYIHINADYTT